MNKNEFNKWASNYDESVNLSDDDNTYPFAGYNIVLKTIYNDIVQRKNADILDIGFGTGTLISKLYDLGYNVWGQDFSERMIELAKKKIPNAKLYQGDFTKGIVAELQAHKYDFIIATYSLHHLTNKKKINLIHSLFKLLKEDGKIIIGDVAFKTLLELNLCKVNCGDEWDDEEYYFIYDEISKLIPYENTFEKISHCGGIIRIFY